MHTGMEIYVYTNFSGTQSKLPDVEMSNIGNNKPWKSLPKFTPGAGVRCVNALQAMNMYIQIHQFSPAIYDCKQSGQDHKPW